MAAGEIYTTTGSGSWAADGNDPRATTGSGVWHEGEQIYEASTVEDPPGTFTTTWAKIWDRIDHELPQGYPTKNCNGTLLPSTNITDAPCLQKGPELTGPSDHTVSWDAPTSYPEDEYDVQVEWWVDTGSGATLDHTEYVAATTGSATRSYNVEDDVYCILRYSTNGGLGDDEVQTETI